jgi:hypothetical protein
MAIQTVLANDYIWLVVHVHCTVGTVCKMYAASMMNSMQSKQVGSMLLAASANT